MKHKKSELTKCAKDCSLGLNNFLNGCCLAEEIVKSEIGQDIRNGNAEVLMEVSKRFAKCAKDNISFDVDTGEVQDFQNIIVQIIDCCEENNWFNS